MVQQTHPLIRISHPLSVSAERERVETLPVRSPRATNALVGTVSLLHHATSMATSRGQSAALTVLHHRVHNPVDRRIVADRVVARVHQNHLVVLVRRVLVHPVAVQHTQVLAHTAHTALSDRTQIARVLQSVDTLVLGLSVHNTLGIGSLASSTTNSHTVHNVALLRLHSQTTRLIGAGRVRHAAHLRKLTVLPRTNTKDVTHRIALLLSPKLLQILVGTHVESMKEI